MPIEKKCLRCGHEWKSILDRPKTCPRCKRYDWDPSPGPRRERREPVTVAQRTEIPNRHSMAATMTVSHMV